MLLTDDSKLRVDGRSNFDALAPEGGRSCGSSANRRSATWTWNGEAFPRES